MDTNGNQRKRTGRSAKSANNNESPSSTHESTETLEVSAVAISPTLEETETSSNAPVSECRRSSRKKIIKFDVRDLLNKNRKTHKIQIEARIDSNAPSTSKANTASSGNEAVNSKTCNAKDDLLSKQKTFLEKSAIFRRYSISQEHKPPPPPLPMPPLLGKANDNKDSGLSSSTSNRRLSRTQEFFSNVMIKPKQTTSLIVAQIESNTPTTSAAAKRRSLNKSLEYETKAAMSSHQESVTSVQQKKRGRPAKFKTPEAVSNETETKKISPEKAKNWKEYKACLAQQTDSSDKVIKQQNEKPKDDIVFTTFEETTQSDILKSDDDGNFSGFQTNKDDTSCDSPVLDKFALAKDVDVKKITKIVEDKKLEEFATNEVVNILQADVMDSNQMILNETDQKAFEKEVAEEELTKQQEELIAVNKLEKRNETSFLKKVDETLKDEKNIGKTTELSQKHETEIEVDNQSANETIDLAKPEDDKSVPEIYDDVTEPPVTENKPEELPIHSKCIQLNKDDNKNVIPTNQNENEHEEIILECNILLEEDSSTSDAVETPSKSARTSKTPDIVKANKLIDECSPETKLTSSDILLLTSQLTPSQPPTPSEETTKSSSRTSSSSESENTSTYSSDPASTSSSSTFSSRSYKSGDKLRVSLKRISLPKSPSTSSQTSTSEELNSGLNPEIVKKKPPMGKRSKRLQRKLLDKSKIIDDCFQKIEDTKNVDEILQSQNIKDESFKSKINTEAIQKSETTQNIERICTESLEKDSCIETSKTNITDAMSTNIKLDKDDIVKDTSTVVKRKSLRNRKEIVRDNTEIPTEKEIVAKDANEEVNIDEKLCESHIELESQISLENDLNEETKKIKNSQPIKQRLHRKFKKLISSEEEEKSNSEVKEEIILLSSDTSKDIQETNSNIQTTETIITEISSIDNNPPVKITDKEEQLSKTTTYKSKSKKEVETTDLPETVEKEQEICTTTISTRKKTNNELNTLEELLEKETNKLSEKISNQEQKIGMSSTRRQTNKEDINPEEMSEPQVKSIAISSTRSKTIEEISNPEETTDSQSTETKKLFRTKANLKAEVESSESSPVRTKSHTASKLDNTPEYTTAESNMTLEHVPEPEGNDKSISEETKAYTSPDENITTTLKETDNNELEKNSIVTRSNTNKEEASKQKSKSIADNVTNQEVSKNLIETRTAVDVSQESTDKYATVTKESADGKSKVTVTRSKANKEPLSTEVMEVQIDKSTKNDLQIKTSEENVGEGVVDTSEHNQSHNTNDYKNVEGIKSTVTRGKTNEDESNNITPVRSKIKESIEIPEMPKSKTSSETEVSSNSTKPNEKKKPETFKLLEIVETDVKQKTTSPKRSIKNVNQPMEISQTSENEILSLKSPTLTASAKKIDMPVEVIQTFQVKNLEDISQVNISKISPSSANKMDMSLEDSSISQDKNLDESHENNSNSKFSLVETNKSEISTKAVLLEAVSTDGVSKIPTETPQTSSEFNLSSKIQEILKDDVENDPTTSNKRKSLRNQMEKETIDEPITLVTQTAENADNPQQLEEIYISTSEKAVKQQNDTTVKEDIIKPTKRRSRKSRFKNLHTPDIESETDSNNGNNTPIAEILQQQQREPDRHADIKENKAQEETQDKGEIATLEEDEIAKAAEKTSKTQNTQDDKNITKIAKPNDNEPSKTNLSTSQIQNVSIETNTLLDILRTVQSNTEAALKASKTSTDIQNQETQNFVEIPEKACMEVSLTNTTQVSQATNIASPTRSETNSPLTLKRMLLSPTRSDSASPLTLKKVTQSPTRSDSSSPLTLKKITRRYERRSRRGEESVHKTLEETFAEIAAESSKAVLAAKEHDINEEVSTTTDENPPKETSNIDKEQQLTKALPKTEKSLVCAKDSVKTNVNTMENVTQTEIKSLENEIKNHEKAIETQESCKVTPVRRGRKPKQRPLESAENKEQSEEKLTYKELIDTNPKDNSLKLTELKDESKEMYSSTEIIELSQMENKHPQETKNDHKTTKTKKLKEMVPIDVVTEVESKSLANLPTISSNNEINKPSELTEVLIPTSSIIFDDKAENKAHKKPLKKRDSLKTEAVSVELNLDSTATKEKEDEVKTPKQLVKKRDTSQTKSGGKKTTKKTKNEEEDSFTITKDDTLTKSNSNLITTTPPPSKRGRKPKSQQETPQSTAISKKKNKKDQTTADNVESDSMLQERSNTLDSESEVSHLDKSFDEKLAKKKRQKKLKEAFEAALTEDVNKAKESEKTESSSNLGLTRINKSPTPPQITANASNDDSLKITCVTPVEAEEEPDPLKDIEKFIADGVNLLKKDYKLDEDSVDDVLTPTPAKTTEVTTGESVKSSIEETEAQIFNTFETPADTPINTPSATPPPKSPTSIESSTPDENSGVRRSHRIKLITKTPKALVGRGLVRDKERFSIKDDVETKSHYTLDDHLTDLAEVEAKNAKFLKEMEERLSNFQVIKENEYLCERVISREARKMICDCFLTHEEEERGELGCGEDCLNRLLMIECGPDCNVKERCTNKRFQKLLCSPCRVFRTEKKGFGIMADIEILPGEFIMEYVGEVIDTDEFEKRRIAYSQDKNRHYYFMALRSDAIIDATIKGNISRFINHSCDPNAETQKWTVNGELRIGFFSRKSIMPGEEITFNYQYQRYGREAQRCYCESANCTGWIGQEPTSDEGEQIDDDDDESEDEEEADTSNLLVQDDDEDSDASVADPEEVQKQLEMAAAQAEVELAPIQLLEEKDKEQKLETHENKSELDVSKNESDEDSKSKFKKLLSKMAEKVAAKQKQTKREQKLQRKKKSKESSGDLANKMKFLEDPDIEDEVEFLRECGLKNQADTLRLSRLMVRAKLVQTRLNLLEILRKGDLPCRRLFLDYHGLRLLHGWMSEDAGNMQIRLSLLQTLETLPIANKTVLTDSKVMQVVRNWCGNNTNLSPNDDSSSSNSNSQDVTVPSTTNSEESTELADLQKLALKLITTWEGLPEIFRIPKKERIEQMKEHEREADRQYAANVETQQSNSSTDRYRRDRFGRGFNTSAPNTSSRFSKPNNGNQHRTINTTSENIKNLSKAQRREMFEAKVARDEAEKRLAEERREFETKCRFFGLDPKKTRPQDIPFCVNPATGQWFSIERKPITTPPSYAHVQVPVKPKSTDPNDYQLPAVCSTLPLQWKYAITPQGKIYYYHVKHRIPQWEPPTAAQLQECEMEDREEDSESELTTTAGEDSSDDDDEVLIGMDAAQLKAYIDRKVELRRQKRYQRLVDERSISPRREEDRIYNQIEVRKYKENKEKIRKRKEEIRRKRAEALRQTSLNMCTLGSINETNPNANKTTTESDEELGALPIQDYLLSSDEEDDLKAEVNSPLMDKIVEGDKIVDELDALTTKRQLKRPLPPHRDLSEASTSSGSSTGLSVALARQEYKKRKLEKKEKRKPKEQQDAKYRKNKEKFRCEIAGIIVHHLKPYLKDTCTVGRIQSNEDFNHLARKLTHFVMIKELKYCESVGQTLVVTESVKSKSREFIKKYMAKYGDVYVKPLNDPDFKDIPFTL